MTRLYLFSLVLHFFILIPWLIKAPVFPQTTRHIVHRLLDTVTDAAPVMLPTMMLLVVAVAGRRLLGKGMMLIYPEALKRGAAVDVVCFDKTGTLTESAVSLVATAWLSVLAMPSASCVCLIMRITKCALHSPFELLQISLHKVSSSIWALQHVLDILSVMPPALSLTPNNSHSYLVMSNLVGSPRSAPLSTVCAIITPRQSLCACIEVQSPLAKCSGACSKWLPSA